MTPIPFKEQTGVAGRGQPEYLELPMWQGDRETISCWKLSIRERIRLLFSGRLWLRQLNFRKALQPQRPQVESPFIQAKRDQK